MKNNFNLNQYLLNKPLYQKLEFDEQKEKYINCILNNPDSISTTLDCYCNACKKESTFKLEIDNRQIISNSIYTIQIHGFYNLKYHCTI